MVLLCEFAATLNHTQHSCPLSGSAKTVWPTQSLFLQSFQRVVRSHQLVFTAGDVHCLRNSGL
jgi:hypothetical protein